MTDSAELLISLSIEDGDETELDEMTRELRSEIEQLSIDSVNSVSLDDAPAGTKAVDWASIGNLIVALTPTVVPPLFDLLKSWINRRPATPVKIRIRVGKNKTAQIEYDPTITTAEDLDKLIKSLGRTIKK